MLIVSLAVPVSDARDYSSWPREFNSIMLWKATHVRAHLEAKSLRTLPPHTHRHNRLTTFGPGLPGWADTRRHTHSPPSWSSDIYQLPPFTSIHSILLVQSISLRTRSSGMFAWRDDGKRAVCEASMAVNREWVCIHCVHVAYKVFSCY